LKLNAPKIYYWIWQNQLNLWANTSYLEWRGARADWDIKILRQSVPTLLAEEAVGDESTRAKAVERRRGLCKRAAELAKEGLGTSLRTPGGGGAGRCCVRGEDAFVGRECAQGDGRADHAGSAAAGGSGRMGAGDEGVGDPASECRWTGADLEGDRGAMRVCDGVGAGTGAHHEPGRRAKSPPAGGHLACGEAADGASHHTRAYQGHQHGAGYWERRGQDAEGDAGPVDVDSQLAEEGKGARAPGARGACHPQRSGRQGSRGMA